MKRKLLKLKSIADKFHCQFRFEEVQLKVSKGKKIKISSVTIVIRSPL